MAEERGVRLSEGKVELCNTSTNKVGLTVDGAGEAQVMVNNALVAQFNAQGAQLRTNPLVLEHFTPTTITTAGAATYTAANLASGMILRDPNGAGRTDLTDTAALIIAGTPALSADGDTLRCYLINTADAAETITLGSAALGVTYQNAALTIAQNECATLLIRRTSSTAVTIHILANA